RSPQRAARAVRGVLPRVRPQAQGAVRPQAGRCGVLRHPQRRLHQQRIQIEGRTIMLFVYLDVNEANPLSGVQAATYLLEIVANLMVAHLPDGLALVDTGSSCSIDSGRPLVLLGRTLETRTSLGHVLDVVSRELDRKVDWLLGNNVLGLCRVELDWSGRRI